MGSTGRIWEAHRADERSLVEFSPHGRFSLALAYPNSYHIGMSNLGFQRTWELVNRRPDWSCERFFSDGEDSPVSVETESPLNAFGAIAFSVSFEEDYVNLVGMLDRAGIPLRRSQRKKDDPLIIVGGSCASINPLPLVEFADVFALGAAENLLEPMLSAFEEAKHRDDVIERLAKEPGFFLPDQHRPEELGAEGEKLRKLDLTGEQMRLPGALPSSAIVTPRTEFSEKVLIEMSRGCPEKCRYCWATFGMGRFRWHPTEFILEAMERAREVTDQVGFVATAVGDHPEIERILQTAGDLGFRSSVSSIRIPAVTDGVLAALRVSGDKSITLAPETGDEDLRRRLNKPISNELLLEKVRLVFRHGFNHLKLYFLVGLPGETLAEVEAILDLVGRCREIMLEELAPTGVAGQIHLGANVLVPKPYTGWQREPMESPAVLEKKIALLRRGAAGLPNVSLGSMSIRQAIWQTYLSKAGSDAAEALEAAARGAKLSTLLRQYKPQISREVFERKEDHLRWQFMRSA